MKPREFLSLADGLTAVNSPAHIRSAISRAYYAAFHVGIDTLHKLGFSSGKGAAAHAEVQRCFVNSTVPAAILAGQRLAELHSKRIRADYHLERIDVEQLAGTKRLLNDAHSVIETFEQIPASPHRAQIQSAIATWRKSNGYP